MGLMEYKFRCENYKEAVDELGNIARYQPYIVKEWESCDDTADMEKDVHGEWVRLSDVKKLFEWE